MGILFFLHAHVTNFEIDVEEETIEGHREPSRKASQLEFAYFNLNFDCSASRQQIDFANFSELELDKLVEARHFEKTKKTTNWSVSTFRGKRDFILV